jgi:hypothetical protein
MQDEARSEKSYEDLLSFREVYLGIFYAFSMKGAEIRDKNGKAISREEAKAKINNGPTGYLSADWNDSDDYAKGFEYAQKFLLDKLPPGLIRLKLNGPQSLSFRLENAPSLSDISQKMKLEPQCQSTLFICNPIKSQPIKNNFVPIDIYLSIFPDNDLGELFFNIKLKQSNNLTTDYLISLIHCLFEDRIDVDVTIPNSSNNFDLSNGKHKMGDIVEKYAELVRRAFDVDKSSINISQSVKRRILEIRDSGDGKNSGYAEEFLKNYPKQVYGLMMGDEGWRFVSKEFSEQRIKERWGSRDFVSVLASSVGVMLLNFRNSNHHDRYLKTQKALRPPSQSAENENYFSFNYGISGMAHGPFLCLEKAVLTRLILDQQNDQLIKNIKGYDKEKKQSNWKEKSRIIIKFIVNLIFGNRDAQKKLEKLSRDVNELYQSLDQIYSDNKLWESDNIYKNLNKVMELDEDTDKTKIRLGDFFNQQYSVQNNRLMSSLTNKGLRLAVASILVGAFLAIIGLYLSGAQIYLNEKDLKIIADISQNFRDKLVTWINPIFA